MLRAGGGSRVVAASLIGAGLTLQIAPSVLSFREHWSQRDRGADERPPGPTLARIAFAAATSTDGTWHTGDAGLPGPAARLPVPAWDLWPVRVEKDLPRHAGTAWTAWAALLFGVIAAAAATSRTARSAGSGR
jgi:hypothetical protein